MSTDNRTQLNDCSATTGWTGDDSVTVVSEAGLFYEGGSSLATQLSNSDEHMYTTSIGGTRNLSDATCYMVIKDNLTANQAGGGIKYVLTDGTDVIGYEVGGNDVTGLSLPTFFNAYRLDVSNSAAFTAFAFSGSEGALGKTAITGVGYGTIHASKAAGAIDNVWMDGFYFIANGSAALTINGGTSGTPETLTDVAGDDVTNGWGMVANPAGSLFTIAAPVEWGDSGTASSYFSQSDSQIFIDGTGIGADNFDFKTIGNTTGTNLFQLNNCVLVNLGAKANWDFSDANMDTSELVGTQFVDFGTFVLPPTGGTSRKTENASFVNCGQVNPSTGTVTSLTFNGTTDANGAILGNIDMNGHTFISDGTGHAIYITSAGTYDYDNNSFSGYGATASTDAVVYNNSGGAVTINVNSGATPTYRNGAGASTTIVAGAVTIQVTATRKDGTPVENARIYLRASSGTGPFPYLDSVTITRSTTTATVSHTGHGLATNDKIQLSGITDKTADNGIHQITVTDANTYTYTTTDSGSTSYTGTITSTFIALSGLTNASGILSTSKVYPSTQPLVGWARKSSSAPYLQEGVLVGSATSTGGFSGTAVMLLDE